MSNYDYTDSNCDTLRVISGPGNNVRLLMLNNTSCWVKADDAPAVALAILEAAGYDNPNHGPGYVARILRVEVEAIERKAEREAEDAKALAFRKVVFPGIRPGAPLTPKDRDLHNAARRFFEGS